MNRVEAWFRIVRPPIVIISVVGASVGALNVTIGAGLDLPHVTYAMTCIFAALLSAGLMVHNDYYDLPSDRVTRPHKPLPSGIIRPETAKWTGFALMAAAVLVALFGRWVDFGELDFPTALMVAFVFIVGLYYNARGKYTGIWGHVMVAIGVGLIPYVGAMPFGDYVSMAPLAAGIGVMEVGREIMVCAGDIEGDRAAGFCTLPVKVGQRRSLQVTLGFYIASVPLFYMYLPDVARHVPGLREDVFGPLYFVGTTVFLVVLFVLWALVWRKPTWESFEAYIRTGSRLAIFAYQLLLVSEAFL
ncbi:MAG: UbiA family prenyltransferase [Thermoplasmata archaeon]|nr:MAG: UbiA family prenyltransferase [Thermoplasmata archaeon]